MQCVSNMSTVDPDCSQLLLLLCNLCALVVIFFGADRYVRLDG
eukprot:COSAG06_NODE_2969_length_6015_cov_19.009297_5_plen_43_part_00